jgi:tripartite-type tricarboxylate transporter receptor subunit TctC
LVKVRVILHSIHPVHMKSLLLATYLQRLKRRDFAALLAATLLATALQPSLGFAQEATLPRTVTMVVPYAAGGVTDALARSLAKRLAETWNVAVIVENKPGAGTVIGTSAVARAPGDGSTLLVTSFGYIANQIMLPNLPYAPTALSPLALMGESTGVLYVHPSVPATNVDEFVRWLRARATPATFASSGNGSSVHVMSEMFAAAIGTPIVHVPYRGNAPAVADLIGGQVNAMFDSAGAMTHVKSGRLRALAVSTEKRSMLVPELPTVAESGLPALAKFDAGSWFGVFIPSSANQALQTRIHAGINAALNSKGMAEEMLKVGVEQRSLSQLGFADFLKRQHETWGPVIRSKNIRPD